MIVYIIYIIINIISLENCAKSMLCGSVRTHIGTVMGSGPPINDQPPSRKIYIGRQVIQAYIQVHNRHIVIYIVIFPFTNTRIRLYNIPSYYIIEHIYSASPILYFIHIFLRFYDVTYYTKTVRHAMTFLTQARILFVITPILPFLILIYFYIIDKNL